MITPLIRHASPKSIAYNNSFDYLCPMCDINFQTYNLKMCFQYIIIKSNFYLLFLERLQHEYNIKI